MNIDIYLVYVGISFVYILSPGPAVFLAVSNGLTANMKAVVISSAANVLGLLIVSTISIAGLGAILVNSSAMFMLIKIVGAAYLIYLGFKKLYESTRGTTTMPEPSRQEQRTARAYFVESFLLAVTNPKAILFFMAFFPQFLKVSSPLVPQFLLLTTTFMSLSFFVLCGYGYLSRSTKHLFSTPVFMQWFHRITGGIFILMAVSILKLKNNQTAV